MDLETSELNEPAGSITTPSDRVYNLAKACLGKHITLDDTVPHDLGCAEAVSFILNGAGVQGIPHHGIEGTAALNTFLSNSPLFQKIKPTIRPVDTGLVWISPSGFSSKGAAHGHVGITGKFGILSNDSATGLFLEFWTVEKWLIYYVQKLGFPVFVYKLIK